MKSTKYIFKMQHIGLKKETPYIIQNETTLSNRVSNPIFPLANLCERDIAHPVRE